MPRAHAGKPAQITFTLDFHELVTGDLRPGFPVVIRYDPLRLVPPEENYVHGDPERPVVAYIRFREDGPVLSQALYSRAGIVSCPDIDPTGQGSMLRTQFDVPSDADHVILWFSYRRASGNTLWDSDYGANYHLGFPSRDLVLLDAIVTSDPRTLSSRFGVRVSAAPAVEALSARLCVMGDPACTKTEVALRRTGETDRRGNLVWFVDGVAVPYQSIVRFELFYLIRGHRFKDDNAGCCYLAPLPGPEEVPPPPEELVRAAQAWG